jgi:hypothetical protein
MNYQGFRNKEVTLYELLGPKLNLKFEIRRNFELNRFYCIGKLRHNPYIKLLTFAVCSDTCLYTFGMGKTKGTVSLV